MWLASQLLVKEWTSQRSPLTCMQPVAVYRLHAFDSFDVVIMILGFDVRLSVEPFLDSIPTTTLQNGWKLDIRWGLNGAETRESKI